MADRTGLLNQINEVSFAVNDLTLYLDTHPLDTEAMNYFTQVSTKRKNLMKEYAEQFGPLTMDCVCTETNNRTNDHTKYPGQKHWTWSDGPLPWEGGMC